MIAGAETCKNISPYHTLEHIWCHGVTPRRHVTASRHGVTSRASAVAMDLCAWDLAALDGRLAAAPASPSRCVRASCGLPVCRGGMGEALWIRRGTLARMACEIKNCVILTPRASVPTGGRICGCSNTLFFLCFIAINALLNVPETREQTVLFKLCFYRRGAPQYARNSSHSHFADVQATSHSPGLIFLNEFATPAHMSLRFCIFGSRPALRCRYL